MNSVCFGIWFQQPNWKSWENSISLTRLVHQWPKNANDRVGTRPTQHSPQNGRKFIQHDNKIDCVPKSGRENLQETHICSEPMASCSFPLENQSTLRNHLAQGRAEDGASWGTPELSRVGRPLWTWWLERIVHQIRSIIINSLVIWPLWAFPFSNTPIRSKFMSFFKPWHKKAWRSQTYWVFGIQTWDLRRKIAWGFNTQKPLRRGDAVSLFTCSSQRASLREVQVSNRRHSGRAVLNWIDLCLCIST
jgi:hypothetical protein